MFFDMQNTGLKNMDMEFIQYMINLFKLYYPWMLNYIIVLEMPWLLNGKNLNYKTVIYEILFTSPTYMMESILFVNHNIVILKAVSG